MSKSHGEAKAESQPQICDAPPDEISKGARISMKVVLQQAADKCSSSSLFCNDIVLTQALPLVSLTNSGNTLLV